MSGPIPIELGSLANLETLDLDGNDLTGAIPVELGSLANLRTLDLSLNDLSGPIPVELGSLASLRTLHLGWNDLSGPIPDELRSPANLETLDLAYNWGLSGPLPAGLELSALEVLDIFATRTCAPAALQAWLATIEFLGPPCEAATGVTIDVAVVYTPAAREAAGGAAAIEAEIDLMIAETNAAYAASGVSQRLALAARSEVPYTETSGAIDVSRLQAPSDGYLDEAHALREASGADLVHLIVAHPDYDVCGIATLPAPGAGGAFGVTRRFCGALVFAHELGHNMGLHHDRFQVQAFEASVHAHPGYGYVNPRTFEAGAPQSSRWRTVMSYDSHCRLAEGPCSPLFRFSNPRQRHGGDPRCLKRGSRRLRDSLRARSGLGPTP